MKADFNVGTSSPILTDSSQSLLSNEKTISGTEIYDTSETPLPLRFNEVN